jgi:hypothetical protein
MPDSVLPVATLSNANPSGHHDAACHRPTDTTLLRHRPAPVLMPSCRSRRCPTGAPTPPYNQNKFIKLKGLGATYTSRDKQTYFFILNNLIWVSSIEMC